MINPVQNALVFLINVSFDLFLFILLIRFLLCLMRANYFNPITQFVVKMTAWLIHPLRRLIPTTGNIEWASLIAIILLDILKFYLLALVLIGGIVNPIGLFILAIADILKLLLNTFFYAILLQAILSWIHVGSTPVLQLLHQFTGPLMRPMRRLLPPMGGFDLSPIPLLIIIQFFIILLINPLLAIGANLTFG